MLALLAALSVSAARAQCVDESSFDKAPSAATAQAPQASPHDDLRTLVRQALDRSNAIGAARLLAEAAEQDTEQARAAKRMQVALTGSLGPGVSRSAGVTYSTAVEGRVGFTVSQILYDGGRNDRLIDWRAQLAESAHFGQLNLQEQVALNTVSLSVERNRFRIQSQVYGQYVRKMGCLVQALQTIVNADKGRYSELVQARKSLQQAEILQAQALSQSREVDVRLRRLVGDGLPVLSGLSTLLLQVPEVDELQAAASRSSEIAQYDAQSRALHELARSIDASKKPSVIWNLGVNADSGLGGTLNTANSGRNAALSAGMAVSIPLSDSGLAAASDAAYKRARAAELQRADALDTRLYKIAEVHEQTVSSFDRMRRVAAVLRDSDSVRNFTLQQWQQLGKRSLFDVMAAEGDYYSLRVAYVNALSDGQQLNAILLSLGRGISEWLQ